MQITRKIRIYPNPHQRELFKKCFGSHNYFYNKAIESLKKSPKNNLEEFRKEFIPRDTQLVKENEWMKEIPLDTREEAARKAKAAQKTGFTQLKSKIIKTFDLKYRSKRRNNNVFYCAKKALIDGAIFSRRLKNNKHLIMKSSDRKFLKRNDGIFLIIQEKDNKY